ncbi:MAG: carboxylesterase/lipase family protein [Erysipelotrichaceae bacterium]
MKQFKFDSISAVKTTEGDVKGYFYGKTHIFKGIPYAQAERFQMPKQPDIRSEVLDATSYGMVCPLLYPEKPNGEMLVPHMYWPQSEHCQSLNIWSPSIDHEAKKPVLVWLHGGGFFAGSSIEQIAYDGENLSEFGDVVVVSLNHRLNILGFMDLSSFGAKYKNSANVGLADIVEALRWLKRNIKNFGGDPDNITLFGQSGGGMKVSAMMQIAEAAELFHKGIIMSGVAGDFMPAYQNSDGRVFVEALMKELNLKSVEQLESIPYPIMAAAYLKLAPVYMQKGEYVGNNPRIDDYYLGEPQMTSFSEKAKTTPLMIGTVFGEFSFAPIKYNKYQLTEPEMLNILKEKFKDGTDLIVAEFKKAYPDKKIVDVLHLDTLFRPLTKEYIKARVANNSAPTYSYQFTLDFACQFGKPAWHCADIPFVFHNVDKVPVANITGVSEKLQDQIAQAIIEFAYKGNPNHQDLPEWKSCQKDDEVTMIFDENCEVKHNFDELLIQEILKVCPTLSIAELMAASIQH